MFDLCPDTALAKTFLENGSVMQRCLSSDPESKTDPVSSHEIEFTYKKKKLI